MRRWILAALAGALALAPVAGLAAIDNSHHDMTVYASSTEKCAYCHSKSVAQAAIGVDYGQVGTFCVVVCHDGGVLTNAQPTPPGYFDATYATVGGGTPTVSAVAFDSSHGKSPGNLDAADPDNTAGLAGSGWPHSSATADMECTTCHSVHDGTNPPFLNRQLGTGANGTAFCQACHNGADAAAQTTAGRYEDIANMGAHPTEFTLSIAGAAAGASGGNALKLGRTILIKPTLLTANPGVAKAAFNTPGNHWETGGHFLDTTDFFPSTTADGSTFGCYSCHSAHQDASATVGSNLILADMNTGTASLLCAGCHGATGTENNPGVSNFYHPANAEAAAPYQHDYAANADPNLPDAGNFPIPIRGDTAGTALTTAVGANYLGTTQEVLCVTCHDVHGGVPGLMSIRAIDATVSTTSSVCIACHQASTDNGGLVNNFHHPGLAQDYSGVGNGAFAAAAAWVTIDNLGDLTDGLSCPDCHVFQGSATHRATAHNW